MRNKEVSSANSWVMGELLSKTGKLGLLST